MKAVHVYENSIIKLQLFGHITEAINLNSYYHCALFVGGILTAAILTSCFTKPIIGDLATLMKLT